MRSVFCKSWLSGLVLLVAGCLAGCAGHVAFEGEPAWYSRSSGFYLTSRGRVFYGIGVAAGTGSSTLLRATADNRARQQMAKILERYLVALAHNSPLMGKYAKEEQEQLTGRLRQRALERAVISDHWIDPHKRLSALCEMHMDALKEVIRTDAAMGSALRSELMAAADALHARLSQNFQADHQ